MLKRIFSNKKTVFIAFIILHLALININYAEWGDSYRILRAADYIREFTYPTDEKRMPLFSFFLSLRPGFLDQVLWGRIEMFVFSILSLWVFNKLLEQYRIRENTKKIALWLFALNPIIFYWSLRIMADVPFMMLVLLSTLTFNRWKEETNNKWLLIATGVFIGLSILTRFEGYLLAFSIFLGLTFNKGLYKDISENLKIFLKRVVFLVLPLILVIIPWLIYRNPFLSVYFEEPKDRTYDFNTVVIYIASLIYGLGFTGSIYFLSRIKDRIKLLVHKNFEVFAFVFLELVLALLWPAAIPRLFIPILPFLVIALSMGISDYFETNDKISKTAFILLIGLVFTLPFIQLIYKLQFLVLNKIYLGIILISQLFLIAGIFFKKYQVFYVSLLISAFVWSLSTVFLHKDIYKTNVIASKYAANNFRGKFAYNDVNAVSDWYLNQKNRTNNKFQSIYLNMDGESGRAYELLLENNVDYVLITNEHNTDMTFSADETNYLEEIKEFRYTIGGKEFFSKILKFNK